MNMYYDIEQNIQTTTTLYLPNALEIWLNLIEHGLELTSIRDNAIAVARTTMVIFAIGNRKYGLPATMVRAIRPLGNYMPLPFTHPLIVGVFSTQQETIAILDIRPLVTYVQSIPHPDAEVLIVQLKKMEIGLLTDGIVAAGPLTSS